ncbi:helix-turn-helix domain-containing protein [Rummeliibacillus stabekisii]|uniref:helix-turn-helix domain-containing protein n=1 Tax=Rummeliibacillus stabekisii TaxID=241244 RepID=UPI003710FAC8
MAIKFNLDRIMFERGNMKVPELVELSGLNKNTLYSFYKGDIKRFDLDTLEKLCTALKCQPGDLLEFKEEQK